MKVLILNFILILTLGTTETIASSLPHSKDSGELNLSTLKQIENLIRKKAGAEFEKNSKNSFELNGHNVYSGVVERRFSPTVFEESFVEIQNPDNEFRIRLIKNVNGDRELAILIKEGKEFISYHAYFDANGFMFEDDPWGDGKSYTIEIFDIYNQYKNIYAQRVDAVNNNQQSPQIFLTEK